MSSEMVGDGGLGGMMIGLLRLRAHNPDAFAEIAHTLDDKIEELLDVCRTIEARLRESGDLDSAALLGLMVLEWETALEIPALTFPFLLEREDPS